jgi:hypothetical protein
MSFGMFQIMSQVLPFCRRSPLTQSWSWRADGCQS